MSRIIDKAFDASRKIVRSIFKGSPNLITSADLNRQMEAFKYQLDQLDEKTGMVSDIRVEHSVASGTLTLSYNVSFLRFKGCEFNVATTSPVTMDINFTNSAPTAYLCLIADKKTVTYDDDSTHEIAGAKFADGTSMPAANQIVYENERIVLTHALSSLNNLVGVIGVFQLSEETGAAIFKGNFMPESTSLKMSGGGIIVDYNKNLAGAVNNGKSYDEAFSILENRANNLVTNWTYLTDDTGRGSNISFKLQNGVMYLNLPAQDISLNVTKMGAFLAYLGSFPSEVNSLLNAMFKGLNIPTYNKFNPGGLSDSDWIPYGDFGTFPVFSPYQVVSDDPIVEAFPKYGLAKISLVALYGGENNGFSGLGIAAYIDHIIEFSSNGKTTYIEGPVNWLSVASPAAHIYVPRIFGVLPLPGKF